MFLKRKRCGQVKARGCAHGRKQRMYIDKVDATSPTVATESVFITSTLDATEHRYVGIVDVPGAFMQADDDDGTIMRVEGRMAEMLAEIDNVSYMPNYCFGVSIKGIFGLFCWRIGNSMKTMSEKWLVQVMALYL